MRSRTPTLIRRSKLVRRRSTFEPRRTSLLEVRSVTSLCLELGPAARFCEVCGTPVAASAAGELRKTVTVLFCDLTGSTALGESLDPEPLRALLARYFEQMKGIVEMPN